MNPTVAPKLRAVIFDVDGTLADTERDGHRPAFNAAFRAHGLDISWTPEEYGRLLKITGGRRRIAADLRRRGIEDADELAADVHRTKTDIFRERILADTVVARPGLDDLISSLRTTEVRIAVATTGTRSWVEPLVARLLGETTVEVTVTGDDVAHLKPDPEVYRIALCRLGIAPEDALAVEDSAIGLQSARAAGLATAVVTNAYTAQQDFTGAAAVREAYDGPEPMRASQCLRIHHDWWTGRHR